MVRVVLTVALTVAVLAVAVPAVERAGVSRSDAAIRAELDRLVAQGRALSADSDALPGDVANPRRVVELALPERGRQQAGLAELRLAPPGPGETGGGTRITWRLRGGARHGILVEGLAFRAADRGQDTVVFDSGGHRQIVLELVRVGGRRVIRVHRRGFK